MTKILEFKTTVSEAESTLADLEKKLVDANERVAKLKADSKEIAFDAFVKGGSHKAKLDALQAEVATAMGLQEMNEVAIVQAKANLARAQAIEADRVAKEKATSARQLAETLPGIGGEMDKGLEAFVNGLKKIRDIRVTLANLGHPQPASFDLYYYEYLQTVLWRQAGIDVTTVYGQSPIGTTFTSILEAQATYTKTADIFGDAEPVSEVEAETAPVVDRPVEGEPCMTWEKKNTALDTWDKRASKVHAIQH